MTDDSVLGAIAVLVAEEHELRQQLLAGQISTEEEHARLRQLEEALDQSWDLLRRRRAAREEGQDPDAVRPRSTSQVEGYIQ